MALDSVALPATDEDILAIGAFRNDVISRRFKLDMIQLHLATAVRASLSMVHLSTGRHG